MVWLTDGRTDRRTDRQMESSHRWTFVRYFGTQQVPIGMPGQTDERHTIIRPKFHFGRIKSTMYFAIQYLIDSLGPCPSLYAFVFCILIRYQRAENLQSLGKSRGCISSQPRRIHLSYIQY